MKTLLTILTLAISVSAFTQVKDIDGNEYQTLNMGDQVWLSSNLNTTHFRNGDIIPQCKTTEEWNDAANNKQPCWCYYDNDPENGKKYGKLYNWYAVNDSRGISPNGYHVPKYNELRSFENFAEFNAPLLKTFYSNLGGYRQGSTATDIEVKASWFDFGEINESEFYWINSKDSENSTSMFSISSGESVWKAKENKSGYIYSDIMWWGCGMYCRCLKD